MREILSGFLGLLLYGFYLGVSLAMVWWSVRVIMWLFTGGDFPLPWRPFG